MQNMRCENLLWFLEESGSSWAFLSEFLPSIQQDLCRVCLRPATIPNQSEYEQCGSQEENPNDTVGFHKR